MGGHDAVFAARAGYQAIITSVLASVALAERKQFFFPLLPINSFFLLFLIPTWIAHAFFIKRSSFFGCIRCILEFDCRNWPLIRNNAFFAKFYFKRKSVHTCCHKFILKR